MRMQTIEVDQEIFNYLKSKAEPFTDTPNDVLRRLLLGEVGNEKLTNFKVSETPNYNIPPVPVGTPIALEHILQVIYLTYFSGIPRSRATKYVAKIHGGIAPQTVLDKYCRQLNLKASEFDRLIAEPELISLKKILYKKFSRHNEVIDNYLRRL